jgi:hypothetical protein
LQDSGGLVEPDLVADTVVTLALDGESVGRIVVIRADREPYDVARDYSEDRIRFNQLGDHAVAMPWDSTGPIEADPMRRDHLDIAQSLNNLANDLRALGEHAHPRAFDEQGSAMYARLTTQDASTRGGTLAD